jgi:molybdate transport system permease protein
MPIDWFPLWLSLRVALCATILSMALGLPLAWLLAEGRFRGRAIVAAAVDLPLIVPSTVLGWYLLVLLARDGVLGRWYELAAGRPLLFTWQAAVLASTVYATPLVARSVASALGGLDPALGLAARGLGASRWMVFRRVTAPLIRRPIAGASLYAFSRSMAEFGITILIAGNLPGKTQTLSVAVFDAASKDNGAAARALVLALSGITLALLAAAHRLHPGMGAK